MAVHGQSRAALRMRREMIRTLARREPRLQHCSTTGRRRGADRNEPRSARIQDLDPQMGRAVSNCQRDPVRAFLSVTVRDVAHAVSRRAPR